MTEPVYETWFMSGPEEGDKIDQGVFISNLDYLDSDVIEITKGTLRQRKAAAKKIVALLNKHWGKEPEG